MQAAASFTSSESEQNPEQAKPACVDHCVAANSIEGLSDSHQDTAGHSDQQKKTTNNAPDLDPCGIILRLNSHQPEK